LEDAVGKRIRFGAGAANTNPWLTIVGVVGDTRRAGLDVPVFTESYQPMKQAPSLDLDVLLRTRADGAPSLAPAVRAAVREIDPEQPVASIAPLPEVLDETVASRRFSTLLMTIFAAAAVLLAAMGVYGLLAYVVSQQQREIGIRIALGARGRTILQAVGARVFLAFGVGGLAGAAVSLAASRTIRGMLFGIAPLDATSYAAAAVMLAAVAGAAAAFPLRRALAVDPATSLRAE
jgi:putative ABC transport system permease protein